MVIVVLSSPAILTSQAGRLAPRFTATLVAPHHDAWLVTNGRLGQVAEEVPLAEVLERLSAYVQQSKDVRVITFDSLRLGRRFTREADDHKAELMVVDAGSHGDFYNAVYLSGDRAGRFVKIDRWEPVSPVEPDPVPKPE